MCVWTTSVPSNPCGAPGAAGRNWVERRDGTRIELAAADRAEMAPGDVFVIETPGGGGYGPAD